MNETGIFTENVLDIVFTKYPFFSKLIVAFIILLFGFIIGKIVGKTIYKILSELEINKLVKKTTRTNINLEKIISEIFKYTIYFIALILSLERVGWTPIILYFVAGSILVALLISFSLVIKDFVPNFFSGMSIMKKGFLKVGDHIRIEKVSGTILKISFTETRIKTPSGDTVSIPNSRFAKSEVIKLKRKPKN